MAALQTLKKLKLVSENTRYEEKLKRYVLLLLHTKLIQQNILK